jgi:hypothetical protein
LKETVSSLWSLSPLYNLLRFEPETLPRPPRTILLAQVDVKSLGATSVPTFHPATFPYFWPWNSLKFFKRRNLIKFLFLKLSFQIF